MLNCDNCIHKLSLEEQILDLRNKIEELKITSGDKEEIARLEAQEKKLTDFRCIYQDVEDIETCEYKKIEGDDEREEEEKEEEYGG